MKITITGANGFLGTYLAAKLQQSHDVYSVSSKAYDLRRQAHIDALFKHTGTPDIIYHLAADVGGIDYNLNNPASIFYNNVMMNTQLIHKAAIREVKKFIFVGSVCSYPSFGLVPISEIHLWEGPLEESNLSYGTSKLMALPQLEAYHKQYGMDFSYPILANFYGPGDTGFENENKSHLIPNLIKQFCDKPDQIDMWGNGLLTRDLLYVEDAVEALVKLADIDYQKPMNIATGKEISIKEIVTILAALTDYQGEIIWSNDSDRGQQRRCYSVARAWKELEWEAKIGIEEGLKRTVEWYREILDDYYIRMVIKDN